MEIKLNIYEKNEIKKTYTAQGFNLTMGTLEDLIALINLNDLNDKGAMLNAVVKGYEKFKPVIFEAFEGLTEDDYKKVRLTDLVETVMQVGTSAVENLKILQTKNK